MGNTVTRLVGGGLALLGALLLPVAAGAQDYADLPHVYPEADGRYNPPEEIPPVYAEQYKQKADAAAAACEQGAMDACTALGLAFRNGEGRPQNRPVAELLLRRACFGGEGAACKELGELLKLTTDLTDPPEVARLFGKACEFGTVAACIEYARYIRKGVGQRADLAASDAVLRKACNAGGTDACIALARSLLTQPRRLPAREEGRALVDRMCRAGNGEACAEAARHWAASDGRGGERTRDYRTRSCEAGVAESCATLGEAALRADRDLLGTGDDRARTLAFYEKACAGTPFFCGTAETLRGEAQMLARCRSGVVAACETLLALYQKDSGPFADPERALMVLAALCETQPDAERVVKHCGEAGRALLDNAGTDGANDPARAEAYLLRACKAGVAGESGLLCFDLARELVSGERLPADVARGYAMMEALCNVSQDVGRELACPWLTDRLSDDPAAPLPVASGEDDVPGDVFDNDPVAAAVIAAPGDTGAAGAGPDPSYPADADAEDAQEDEEDNSEEQRKRACTTTTVSFEGRDYTDTLCRGRYSVTRGTVVKGGEAPWQALIWRPRKFGDFAPTAQQFVLCGGTVIRRGWVLTAAHCLEDQGYDIRTAGHRLRLGVSNPNVDQGISYRILQTWRHPDYSGPKAYAFDIALIRYDPASGVAGSKIHEVGTIVTDPKPFKDRKIADLARAFTFGWGRTQVAEGPIPRALLRGTVMLRDEKTCQQKMGFPLSRQGSVICADAASGQQACSGDSGGPLIVREAGPRGPNTPVQIGVVSMGKECGNADLPSLFTRLSHPKVKAWMDEVLSGRRRQDPLPRPAPAPRAG